MLQHESYSSELRPRLSVELLVAARVGPRLAECLGGISVGKDWPLFLEGVTSWGAGVGDVWRCFSVCFRAGYILQSGGQ